MRVKRFLHFALFSICVAGIVCQVPSASATYSIAACDAKTRQCGVAVQTNNLAVGASVPYAQAGVGAIVSQFETNPNYGPRGLTLLSQGKSPEEVLQQLLKEDGNFEGAGPESRQVGVVALNGNVAAYTGSAASKADWAGSRKGVGYSLQGNGLVGPHVLEAMEQAFLNSQGTLGERLMAALSAGDAAGGQKTGKESAALLVKTVDGWPADIDLRVDHSSNPVADLRELLNMQLARQQIGQARRAARDGHVPEAKSLLMCAVARASAWSRIWVQAAEVAIDIEEPELALQYLNVAFSQNPAWASSKIGEGKYASLGRYPLFHQWVSGQQTNEVMSAYAAMKKSESVLSESEFEMVRMLLEVSHPREARLVLQRGTPATISKLEWESLFADIEAAEGNYQQAIAHCEAALQANPNNLLLAAKIANLQKELAVNHPKQ